MWIERQRVQRYCPGGHYSHHFDWSSSRGGWGRVSSFTVWVSDDEGGLVGGGTEFPLLERWTRDERWCGLVECDAQQEPGELGQEAQEPGRHPGTVFRSCGWERRLLGEFPPGQHRERVCNETWHAGLPVQEGTKVGLNIWSWGRID